MKMYSKTMWSKIVASVIAVVMSVTMLSGCGDKVGEKGKTTIAVGGWPKKENSNLEKLEKRKTAFEEANPDVTIERDHWNFDRMTFYAKAAGGQLPTVYDVGYTEMPEILSSGYSADLTEVLKKRGYDGMLNKNVLDTISRDGKIYALPYASYILGLGYNTEMFKAAGLMEEDGTPKQPKDWNEVVEFAVKIKEATGKPGFIFPTANKYGGWIFTALAWSFGVDFIEKDKDGKWKATFDTAEAVEALQFVKDLKWKYDVLPSNSLIDGGELTKTFAIGNGAMMIASGDISGQVVQYEMDIDHIGIMAMPAGPKGHVTLLGGGVYCVNDSADEAQIDAAVRWIETVNNFELTEQYKENTTFMLDTKAKNNELIGIKSMSQWSEKSEAQEWYNKKIDEYANSNPNHVKLYNDFVANCPAEVRPEEPVCAQELYGILDGCIQKVLIDESADCAELIKKAASDFQMNYLDNL